MTRRAFTGDWWRTSRRGLLAIAAAAFAGTAYMWVSLPDVRPLRTRPPASTAFMRLRAAETSATRAPQSTYRWVPYSRISPQLARAVVLAEDGRFWSHDGIDLDELQIAFDATLSRGVPLRGASTITQQLAKNLYLSPSRNPIRKLTELMLARRLEAELSKTRILELYLNLIEWGDGVWGAESAARTYFGVPAAALSAEQAALLAAAIINPRVYSPARPDGRLRRRQQLILGRMRRTEERSMP